MMLLTKEIKTALLANTGGRGDQKPVLKLFNPTGIGTWLITELDADGDTMFGLCDLGQGYPEIGCVSLAELSEFRGLAGLGIERDRSFRASKTLEAYADAASAAGYIVA